MCWEPHYKLVVWHQEQAISETGFAERMKQTKVYILFVQK